MTRHSRIIASGQNNWSPRPVQTEAARQHTHGPLLPMDDRLPGDGELQHWLPWITLASGSLVALVIWSLA